MAEGPDELRDLAEPLVRDGFAFVRAPRMRTLLASAGADLEAWDAFAASWSRLGMDTFMADGGRYRRRRFAAFSVGAASGEIARKPHQPHYQSRDYNALNGGVERWFLPVEDDVASDPILTATLTCANRLFTALTPEATRPPSWHVEVHQFRIEAGPEPGQPTPEGMHRDGVDWVLVALVRRENVASGETRVAPARRPAGDARGAGFTLEEPLDAALVDDDRVFHGVTPITPLDAAAPAYRDVLVVTFRRP